MARLLIVTGALSILAAVSAGVAVAWMTRGGFSARDEPSATETFIARRMRNWAIPSALADLKNPVASTPEVLASARAHWADHCAGCHGNDGRGQTELGRGMYPPAPDMREAATQSLSDGALYAIIENGIRLTGMPAWGDGAPDNRASWELVAFIRHLPEQTDAELQQMKNLNPKSVHERMEEQDEESFLEDEGPSGHDAAPGHHGEHR